jgi:hypothetical protein
MPSYRSYADPAASRKVRPRPPRTRRRIAAAATAIALMTTLTACAATHPHFVQATASRPAPASTPHEPSPQAPAATLPISQASLATATQLAVRFAAAYASYAYNQPVASYLAALHSMTTTGLYQALVRSVTTLGLQQQRTRDHLIITSQAQSQAIRDIEPGSLITVVHLSQNITSLSGHSHATAAYAITIISHDSGWLVYDIEPANAGNQGGGPDQNG